MEYQDKVVEVLVTAPVADAGQTSGGGGTFTGLETKDTASTTLVGKGTLTAPLQANVTVSRKAGNRLQVLGNAPEAGLFVGSSEVNISSKPGNIIKNTTAEEAANAGDPTLEGIHAAPVSESVTSPKKTIKITKDVSDATKTTVDVVLSPDANNSLVVLSEGLAVPVSKALDNTLEIRQGALYVRPQETKISADPDNKIEVKADGIFVATVKGDQGEKGEKGDVGPAGPEGPQGPKGDEGATGPRGAKGDQGNPGLGLNVLGPLDGADQLPPVADMELGDTYVIDQNFWTVVTENSLKTWKNIGNFAGPEGLSAYEVADQAGFIGTVDEWLASLKGADGIGLQVLGAFTDPSYLPMEDNKAGDCYIINDLMYVWTGDTDKWQTVGQVGPEGKSAYQVWLANGNSGTQVDFINSLVGEQGPKGDKGEKGDPGVDGKNANAINILGSKATEGDLPAGASAGDAYLVGTNVFVSDGAGNWEDLGSFQGPKGDQGAVGPVGPQGEKGTKGDAGKDNYTLAVEEGGFVGSVTEYLASLKGAKGDVGPQGPRGLPGEKGEQGPIGEGLKILGSFETPEELPTPATFGDAYLVKGDLYVYTNSGWVNTGNIQGPKGDIGPKGDKGAQGEKGDQGIQGVKGDTGAQGEVGPQGPVGKGLTPKGTVADEASLPQTAEVGDFYVTLDTGTGFAWNGTAFVNTGTVRGPQGEKGEQGVEGPVGPKGTDGTNGTDGAPGPALTAKGTVANEAALPASAEKGDFYVAEDTGIGYAWDGTKFVKNGVVRGPQGEVGPKGETGDAGPKGDQGVEGPMGPEGPEGPKGDTGDQGPKGDTGETGPQGPQGDIGPGVEILGKFESESELPSSGTLGQGYLIQGDFWGWTGSAYENLGRIQGPVGPTGPKGDPGPIGIQGVKGDKGDQGSLWVVFPRPPEVSDGRVGDYFLNSLTLEFFRKTNATTWAPMGHLGGGNVYDAPSNGKSYVRKDMDWVEQEVGEAPKDSGYYVRVDGAWQRLDRYDLRVIESTGAIDASAGNVFKIDGTANKSITITGLPPNRAETIVLRFLGKGASLGWPSNLAWSNGTAPVLGATRTIVTLFWDGEFLTGTQALTVE